MRTGKESFFDGHTRDVSCIAISRDGTRIVSGQVNIPGVKVQFYCGEIVLELELDL
jgi:hypothetical protein